MLRHWAKENTKAVAIKCYCRILHCWRNNEDHIDIEKYNLYFYSSTATFVWSWNTVRESSHISFFWGRGLFCEVEQRPENTHRGADMCAWVTSGFFPLHLRDQRISPIAWETSGSLLFVSVTSGSMPSVQNYRPYIVFSSPMRKYEHPLRLTYFLFTAGFRNLHTSFFSGNFFLS